MTHFDRESWWLMAGVGALLVSGSAVGLVLKLRAKTDQQKRGVENLNDRMLGWWIMVVLFVLAIRCGLLGVTILFGLISFLALREMVTLTPTRRGDHHALFWAFFVMVPLQYYLIYIGWYGLWSILIPVYGFQFLAIRSTLTGDTTRYLERTAKIQWGTMICIYCISHAPALLTLNLKDFGGQSWKLLIWLVIVVQMSDVLQYCWGKLLGKRRVAPHISPNKTWEGLVGGVLSATALGSALWWYTPFRPLAAAGLALTVALLGFFGGIVMSAIKRDAGVKDWGHIIAGHGGMMDRIDSLSFAAPVFFHLVRFWYAVRLH
jgi:phosphatidate cytidylyltransferase